MMVTPLVILILVKKLKMNQKLESRFDIIFDKKTRRNDRNNKEQALYQLHRILKVGNLSAESQNRWKSLASKIPHLETMNMYFLGEFMKDLDYDNIQYINIKPDLVEKLLPYESQKKKNDQQLIRKRIVVELIRYHSCIVNAYYDNQN